VSRGREVRLIYIERTGRYPHYERDFRRFVRSSQQWWIEAETGRRPESLAIPEAFFDHLAIFVGAWLLYTQQFFDAIMAAGALGAAAGIIFKLFDDCRKVRHPS
jgi:hypothetical protein